jgi:hypothetical protein
MGFGENSYERRLDVLIAQHVFGWKWFYTPHRDFYILRPPDEKGYIRWNFFQGNTEMGWEGEREVAEPVWDRVCSDYWSGGGYYDENKYRQQLFHSKLPPFSSDWEAAKLVAERLGRHRGAKRSLDISYDPFSHVWEVRITEWTKGGDVRVVKGRRLDVTHTHADMPMALVMATLSLKGVSVKDHQWAMKGDDDA